jgi:hypothetical protein
MNPQVNRAKKLAARIKQSLISEKVILDTTRAIGTLLHPLRAPKSSLEEYLKTFTLGISVSEVHKLIDLLPYAHPQVKSYISYELGNHSPELKGCYKYLRSEGTVTIHTPPTQIRVVVHPPTRPVDAVTITQLDEKQRTLLKGNLPVDKVQIAEEIINTTNDAIGIMFYQADKPKCLMEHFLRDFDLQLSVTNVIEFLNAQYPGWEKSGARCYYELGNISPTTTTRFIYNPDNGASDIVPIQMVVDLKRESSPDWLCANMQPKPGPEIKLEFTVPEGMERTPYFMRAVPKTDPVNQGAAALANQLDTIEQKLKNQLDSLAALFWLAELPNVSLAQYISEFKWPTEKVKIKINKAPLTYNDTLEIYRLMADTLPVVNNLFVRIEQVRYNPHLKGKIVFRPELDICEIKTKVVPSFAPTPHQHDGKI